MTLSDALTTARDMLGNPHCIYSPREYREVIRALLPQVHLPDEYACYPSKEWCATDFPAESRN